MFKSNRKHPPYIIMGMKCMSEYWVKPVYLALGETVADYESLDDHQLIQRISQVDKEALETLYVRYQTPVYSLAMFMLKQPALAEEVT